MTTNVVATDATQIGGLVSLEVVTIQTTTITIQATTVVTTTTKVS